MKTEYDVVKKLVEVSRDLEKAKQTLDNLEIPILMDCDTDTMDEKEIEHIKFTNERVMQEYQDAFLKSDMEICSLTAKLDALLWLFDERK